LNKNSLNVLNYRPEIVDCYEEMCKIGQKHVLVPETQKYADIFFGEVFNLDKVEDTYHCHYDVNR